MIQTSTAQAISLETIPYPHDTPIRVKRNNQLALITGILLLIITSRLIQIPILQLSGDDMWSIWQSLGTPAEIVRWTPSDWPPLFFLSLGAWKALVGIQPIVLRLEPALAFLLGTACLYRVLKRIWNANAALISVLAYSALAYSLYLSLFIRGYAFLMGLAPLALWLTVRYFDHPSPRRAVWLALSLIAMFYSHYTSLFLFALLGLYTLCVYGWRSWRWWLPGSLLLVGTLPQILAKLDTFLHRTAPYRDLQLPPLPEALRSLAESFTGPAFLWWVILFGLASLLIIIWTMRHRRIQPRTVVLLAWILAPVALYFLQGQIGLFQQPKYLWWALLGLALWIGWGLSHLPPVGRTLVSISLVGVMFLPNALDSLQPLDQFGPSFKRLQTDLRAGDVVVVDPWCECGNTQVWDYLVQLYFPNGLHFVTNPTGYPRVWYVSRDWDKDPATEQEVTSKRIPGEFFGPPMLLFRLYEGPPDPTGIAFENGMRFHGAVVEGNPSPDGVTFRAGQTVHVKLWWSVDKPLSLDYSVGLYLIWNGKLVAQADPPSQAESAPKQTSQWMPGQYYVQEREFTLPAPIQGHIYPLNMAVYQWWDNTRIAAPGMGSDKLLQVETISVQAWL